ncbi:MAG: hypothetical protein ACI8RW_001612, partial [Porticoccaceae bacterium]
RRTWPPSATNRESTTLVSSALQNGQYITKLVNVKLKKWSVILSQQQSLLA